MATLTIRRLDDRIYSRLRERAQSNRRSLEAEVREILEENVKDLGGTVDDLASFHDEMTRKHGLLADSTPLIREMRATE